jgi:hypothetical protein
VSDPLGVAQDALSAWAGSTPGPGEDIGDDIRAQLVLLDRVRQLKKIVTEVEWRLEAVCARNMPDRMFVAEGIQAFRNKSVKTTWDTRRLAGAIVESLCVNSDGEVTGDLRGAWSVLYALIACAHIDYWRVADLAKAGIEADEYREREWGRWSVRVSYTDPAKGDL